MTYFIIRDLETGETLAVREDYDQAYEFAQTATESTVIEPISQNGWTMVFS